jgi:hypothetical protein
MQLLWRVDANMDLDDESSNYGVFMFAREVRIVGENGLPSSRGSLALYLREQSHLILRVVAECPASAASAADDRRGLGRGSAADACSSCEMFQREFDARDAARSFRGVGVSEEEALEALATLLADSTGASSHGLDGSDHDDDDDGDELMPGTSAASFQLEENSSSILLRVQVCREAGLVQNRFTATIPRLETSAPGVPFALSLIRAIHEQEAAADKALQEREAAAEQSRDEIEALTEDRDGYKDLAELLRDKWDKEKTAMVDNFLELYKAVQEECEHLREQLRKSTGLRSAGVAPRARTQSDGEAATPTSDGDPVEEPAAGARSPASDRLAKASATATKAPPQTGMRAARSGDPSRKGQPAKHQKREVMSLPDSDSDEEDLLAGSDDDEEEEVEEASRDSRAASHANGTREEHGPAKKARASDSSDAAMEDVDAAPRRPAPRGRAPAEKSRAGRGVDDAAMEDADAASPRRSASGRAPVDVSRAGTRSDAAARRKPSAGGRSGAEPSRAGRFSDNVGREDADAATKKIRASGRAPVEGNDSDDTDIEDADATTVRSPASGRSHLDKSGADRIDDDMDADTEDEDITTHRPASSRPTATTGAPGDSSTDDGDADSEPKSPGRRPASTATSKRQPEPTVSLTSSRDVADGGQSSRATKGNLSRTAPADRHATSSANRPSGNTNPKGSTGQERARFADLSFSSSDDDD